MEIVKINSSQEINKADPPNTFFFGKCFKKKLLNIISIFFLYESQYFRLILENNFIQMAASAGQAVSSLHDRYNV